MSAEGLLVYNKTLALDACPAGLYVQDRECVSECAPGTFGDPESGRCVARCPPFWRADAKTCVPRCPDGLFVTVDGECVSECPGETFADVRRARCVFECADGLFADSGSRACVSRCPQKTYAFKPLLGEAKSRACVERCPAGYFGDDARQVCVNACQRPLLGDPTTGRCVLRCPGSLVRLDGICVSQCTRYKAVADRSCAQKCDGTVVGQTRLCLPGRVEIFQATLAPVEDEDFAGIRFYAFWTAALLGAWALGALAGAVSDMVRRR